jgi:dTDP-4-amino-4,6-dideoxygalactose transaminase
VSEQAAATEISLPMFPELGDDAVQYVISRVRDVCQDLR